MNIHVAIISAGGMRFTRVAATSDEALKKIANWCRAQSVWAPPHIISTEEIDKLSDDEAVETYFRLNQNDSYELFEDEIELPAVAPLDRRSPEARLRKFEDAEQIRELVNSPGRFLWLVQQPWEVDEDAGRKSGRVFADHVKVHLTESGHLPVFNANGEQIGLYTTIKALVGEWHVS